MSGERAKALGRRLQVARDEKGWKKSDTARRLGIKLPTYLRYEDGDRTPSVELLLRASEIYDRPVGWFFADAEATQVAASEATIDLELRRILSETPRARQQAIAEVLPVVNLVCDRMANNQSNAH
jgi:transcriptional regulator with XRE-family HTH domain